MSTSAGEEPSSSPRRKKIKNNEIYSSLSSSEDMLPIRLFSTPVAGSKRKHVSSTEDDEHIQSSKVLKVVPLLPSGSSSEQDENREEEPITSSDKENAEEFVEPVLIERTDKVEYVIPEHFHTEEEYLRDDKKAQARLQKLLRAIDKSKAKNKPEKSPEKVPINIENGISVTTPPVSTLSNETVSISAASQIAELCTSNSTSLVTYPTSVAEKTNSESSVNPLPATVNLNQPSSITVTLPIPSAPRPAMSTPQLQMPQVPAAFNFSSPIPVPQFNSLPTPDGQPALFSLGAGTAKKPISAARRRPRR